MPDWDPLYLQKRDLKLLVMREAAALAACSSNATIAKPRTLCRVPADTPKAVVCHITAVAPMTAPRSMGRRLSEPTSWQPTAPLYKFGVTLSATTRRLPTTSEPKRVLSVATDASKARAGGAKQSQAPGDSSNELRSPELCVHWTTSVILQTSPALWKVLARAASTPTALSAKRDPSTRRHLAPERQFETTVRPPVAREGSRHAAVNQRCVLHATNENPNIRTGEATQAGSKQRPLIPTGGIQLDEFTTHPVLSPTVSKGLLSAANSLKASSAQETSAKEAHVDVDTIHSCCAQITQALAIQLQAARDECTAAKAALHRAVAAQAAIVAASWGAQRDLRDEMQRRFLASHRREAKDRHELQVLQGELSQVAGELEGVLSNHAASVVAYNELLASTIASHNVTVAFLEAQIEAVASE